MTYQIAATSEARGALSQCWSLDSREDVLETIRRRMSNVRFWLLADILSRWRVGPLCPRKQTLVARQIFGLKKRTFNVCLTPESGRKWVIEFMSAFDPKRT
jgi:hypothetical protein